MFYNNLSLIQILLPVRAEHWEMDSQGQIKHTSSGEKESFYENVVSGKKRKLGMMKMQIFLLMLKHIFPNDDYNGHYGDMLIC